MTFTYDATKINDGSLNQMRFELGDTFVAEPEKSTYLADEEYLAVLAGGVNWKRAKLRLVETLLMRFAYEVDTEVHEASWKLHQRVDFWEGLRKRLQGEIDDEDKTTSFGFMGKNQRDAVFTLGMHDWSN